MSATPKTILVFVGSLRQDSLNLKFAKALIKIAPPGYDLVIRTVGDLPLYNQDHDADPAPQVVRLKNEIKAAGGVLFITPEYNRSIPGVLKNAIDHASRPYGQSVWAGKPAAVAGVSSGVFGTAMAQQHLRNVLAHLNMPTLGQPEVFLQGKDGFFEPDGGLAPEPRKLAQKWLTAFIAHVERNAVT